ncbi:unnamed protein product [[Candida] boidinii]|uniref:COX assembly mitochondrial protein n=1 Tax=Candida boidinii TaxID=5477 RepID=A0A9W6SY25_CANBO|nr:unnamed protein product [[Candida] boidinii]GMG30568.1 unnamed protein product [[Candida] boidinii]
MDRKRIEGLPVWMLTPKEEKEVFENWRKNTWKYCDEYVGAFSKCEQAAGYTVWFKCRKESKAMRECIRERQNSKFVDEERDKYIEDKIKFLKAKEQADEIEKQKNEKNEKNSDSGFKFWSSSKKAED